MHHQDNIKKSRDSFKTLNFFFQLRIYGGLAILLYFLIFVHKIPMVNWLVFFLPLVPISVGMVLYYRRFYAFKIWYMIGASLCIVYSFIISGLPISNLIADFLITVGIFKSSYIKTNFKRLWMK